MNIGNAIKLLRSQKGFSQKDFAQECGISTTSLSQIETNQTFPQKSTMSRFCEVLEIPSSYLLFFCLSEDDVPEDKRYAFNLLREPLEKMLLENVKKVE